MGWGTRIDREACFYPDWYDSRLISSVMSLVQERCAQLAALAAGMLPSELAGAGPELAPLRAFVRALLQADPRQRPLVAHLVRSGQLQVRVISCSKLAACW